MRHGSDPGDVCVVQGRSVVVTWAGSGQVKVQKKQANVKDGDYVITPYGSLAERDRPPVYKAVVTGTPLPWIPRPKLQSKSSPWLAA